MFAQLKCPSAVKLLKYKPFQSNRERICLYTIIILLIISLLCSIVLFCIVPVIFEHSIEFERLTVFTNIGLPSDPNEFNRPIKILRNFYITFEDEENETVSLGVWHLLPYGLENETDFDKALRNKSYDVIVHFHGSGETRMDSINMFAVLCNFYHIIAFDYRDYGDSSHATLSEEAIASDAIHIFQWLRSKTDNDIYVWGHSLGTSLSSLTISFLRNSSLAPTGLILEAPFTTLREAIPLHPVGKIFAWLPWFQSTIVEPLQHNKLLFETSTYILKVNCPIMILHAEDDSIIPYTLGKKLAEIAMNDRAPTQGNVTYHQFPASCGYDHFGIWRAPQLPFFIQRFIEVCRSFKNNTNV